MKLQSLFIALSITCSAAALAGAADDVKWINKCIQDNKDEGAKASVVQIYCTCMNNKMDDNERRSISEWEKTHETERKACEREAGWK